VTDPVGEAKELIAAGQARAAVALLQPVIAEGRGGALVRMALGRALLAAGETGEALAILREAVMLFPGVPDVALTLGEALLAAGHLPTAIGEFQRALRLDPQSLQARYWLGCSWLEAGEADKALEIFSQLENEPALKLAEKIAEAEAMRVSARAAPGYVRHLFDQFSADYDTRMLGQLSYRAHVILRELWDLVGGGKKPLDILDLGCGTGLSGAAFNDIARRLDGVDLSPLMLAKARERGIYDSLLASDLETALAENAATYDLILAADTLVYLGDLERVFAGAVLRLKRGGCFLFTVERNECDIYTLGPKRRWQHPEAYLRERAVAARFDVVGLMNCNPRSEAKTPVAGYAVALRKP
jgi:predicted TPR repeat methyltransferase